MSANLPHCISARKAYNYSREAPKIGECGDMPDEQRAGQKAFNELYAVSPEIANQIRGGKYDPFYDDTRLQAFYLEVDRIRANQ